MKTKTITAVSLCAAGTIILLLALSAASRTVTRPRPVGRFDTIGHQEDDAIQVSCLEGSSLPRSSIPSDGGTRAVWVQYQAANTKEKADQVLERLVQAHLDTILYSVGSGSVAYQSKLLGRLSDVAPDFDPLQYLTEQGHARGLKVQAWWSPGYAARDSQFNQRYPAWDIASLDGSRKDLHWLNFSLPVVQRFVGDVVVEIAENYDVDGVHLDYIRYPASASSMGLADQLGEEDVSTTVEEAYRRLKATKPHVLLTAAVMDSHLRSATYMQHWENWLEGEYIDYVMPMAYYSPDDTAELKSDIDEWKSLPHCERIIPGLSAAYDIDRETLTAKTPDQLIEQIWTVRSGNAIGFSIFDEGALTAEQADALRALERASMKVPRGVRP